MSPTHKGSDCLGCFPQLGTTTVESAEEQHQTFESLNKNLNVAGDSQVWNQASEMCGELQPHFTKEDFLQPRRDWNGPCANTVSHGFPTGTHCALLHSSVISLLVSQWGLYVESGVGYIIASNTENQMIDSWVWVHTCYVLVFVFTSVPVSLRLPICPWMWAEELTYKGRQKAQKQSKNRWRNTMTLRADTITMGKEGERGRERGKKDKRSR